MMFKQYDVNLFSRMESFKLNYLLFVCLSVRPFFLSVRLSLCFQSQQDLFVKYHAQSRVIRGKVFKVKRWTTMMSFESAFPVHVHSKYNPCTLHVLEVTSSTLLLSRLPLLSMTCTYDGQ